MLFTVISPPLISISSACVCSYKSVKCKIADLNGPHQSRLISDTEDSEWIPLTDHFIALWGHHMVFPDVQNALNDVKENLDLTLDIWPSDSFRTVPIVNWDLSY